MDLLLVVVRVRFLEFDLYVQTEKIVTDYLPESRFLVRVGFLLLGCRRSGRWGRGLLCLAVSLVTTASGALACDRFLSAHDGILVVRILV